MSRARLRKYLPLLHLLTKKGNKEQKIALIECLSEDSTDFICECLRNAVSPKFVAQFPNTKRKSLLKKISPYKKELKLLITKKIGKVRRKKILQKGGFLSLLPLLTSVIPMITSLVTGN